MRKKYVFIAIGIVLLCVIGWGFYKFNQPHTSAANKKPDQSIDAPALYAAFEKSEADANKIFMDKILEVKGTIAGVENSGKNITITLKGNDVAGVSCSMANDQKLIQIPIPGSAITIKGKCVGFLADVTLTDCVIQSTK
ncbi:OB-fold protein [Chitinophagaceae bacterium LWZ2-11]